MISWLASAVLYLIHTVYALVNVVTSWRQYRFAREPYPLVAERSKLPRHVAILLASTLEHVSDSFEQEVLQNVEQAVGWCRQAGIQRLTLYDRQGILSRLSFDLRARILRVAEDATVTTSESELEYPLTPPLSDSPSSPRSLSPKQEILPKLHVATLKLDISPAKRKNSGRGTVKRRVSRKDSDSVIPPTTIDIVSYESGKTAIAEVANALVRNYDRNSSRTKLEEFTLSVNELQSLVESEKGFPAPDLMLIHYFTPYTLPKAVLELFGFSPWHISLTEFYYSIYPSSWWAHSSSERKDTDTYIPFQEIDLRRALDQYAGAEMRLGK
ncbi:hypothetical protein BDY19DRAFT_44932 [Irpex rosettiformis]|uniref:Uncharacterized protein n=1 Tax=Irpex rosettiformis TaxID=378272 RepID=A0ACB8UMM8_9APHY|nr:hypothetical protein BDY19DRAFT_44932 [Irpex rosettiformis]